MLQHEILQILKRRNEVSVSVECVHVQILLNVAALLTVEKRIHTAVHSSHACVQTGHHAVVVLTRRRLLSRRVYLSLRRGPLSCLLALCSKLRNGVCLAE